MPIAELMTELLVSRYDVDAAEIAPDAVFEELSLDSLALMEISLAMEKKLGVSIAEGVLFPQQTLAQAATAIGSLRIAA